MIKTVPWNGRKEYTLDSPTRSLNEDEGTLEETRVPTLATKKRSSTGVCPEDMRLNLHLLNNG